uniref:F-box associated domain-containing protein n=1 Tax=Hordeum vulgare subsp. vulgare TaxID=112509 RepID=A0A8I6YAK8_HORVV
MLEIEGKLASCSSHGTIIDVWVMQDYEAEDWALKYRIDLLTMPLPWFALPEFYIPEMALLNHRELLLCNSMSTPGPGCLVHCDIDGKLIGYFKIKEGKHTIYFTKHYFQESIIPLPFSEMQEYKEPPFFMGL